MIANDRGFEPGLVSVVIPTFDSAETIEETIRSATRQTFRPIEILVSDDCSRDGTVRVAESLSADSDVPIRIIRAAENGGPAISRNRALEAALGQYVAFLDSDDKWRPTKISKQVDYMEETGAAITHTAYTRIRGGKDTSEKVVSAKQRVHYRDLLKSNFIGMSTAVVDRNQVGDIRLPALRMRQDYALWMTLGRAGWISHGLTEVLTEYSVRSGSLSSNPVTSLSYTWQVFKDYSGLPALLAFWYFLVNASNAVRKRL